MSFVRASTLRWRKHPSSRSGCVSSRLACESIRIAVNTRNRKHRKLTTDYPRYTTICTSNRHLKLVSGKILRLELRVRCECFSCTVITNAMSYVYDSNENLKSSSKLRFEYRDTSFEWRLLIWIYEYPYCEKKVNKEASSIESNKFILKVCLANQLDFLGEMFLYFLICRLGVFNFRLRRTSTIACFFEDWVSGFILHVISRKHRTFSSK